MWALKGLDVVVNWDSQGRLEGLGCGEVLISQGRLEGLDVVSLDF